MQTKAERMNEALNVVLDIVRRAQDPCDTLYGVLNETQIDAIKTVMGE